MADDGSIQRFGGSRAALRRAGLFGRAHVGVGIFRLGLRLPQEAFDAAHQFPQAARFGIRSHRAALPVTMIAPRGRPQPWAAGLASHSIKAEERDSEIRANSPPGAIARDAPCLSPASASDRTSPAARWNRRWSSRHSLYFADRFTARPSVAP